MHDGDVKVIFQICLSICDIQAHLQEAFRSKVRLDGAIQIRINLLVFNSATQFSPSYPRETKVTIKHQNAGEFMVKVRIRTVSAYIDAVPDICPRIPHPMEL